MQVKLCHIYSGNKNVFCYRVKNLLPILLSRPEFLLPRAGPVVPVTGVSVVERKSVVPVFEVFVVVRRASGHDENSNNLVVVAAVVVIVKIVVIQLPPRW